MAYTPKIIVVSNRLPFVLTENEEGKIVRAASAGGLVTAVAPVVIEGDGMWVGWPGSLYKPGMTIPEADPLDNTPTAGLKSSKVIPVALESNLFENYYNGCCNGTFWPLFHSMPDRACFSAEHWKDYINANQLFAEKAVEGLKLIQQSSDPKPAVKPLVWIHDYHLMLAAYSIRKAAIRSTMKFKLGFFLHIPFPPWDIFRLFPWGDHVLQGMLGSDMIGFHTYDYCINFVDCCNRRLRCRVDRKALLVEHGGRSVRVRPLPIGIPYDRFAQLAREAEPILSDKRVILGVDRLDYTKGLPHRLRAFEVLLTKYPQHLEKIVMLQVAVPSRTDVKEYQDLKEEMDQLVGRINGRFATATWSPIRYIYGTLSQSQLASFYRDSAVAFITPLRDGMNLVAKEYVACQVKDPPGVLIISPFAGAGESMNEALICNPYELTEAAEVLHRALTMPEDERTLRMNYLRKREKERDVHYWLKSFLKAMGTLISEDGDLVLPSKLQPMTLDDFDDYFSSYQFINKKLALLLDYDGTLAPLASHPDLAVLPAETRAVLERLANTPDVHISIVSGRSVENVKNMVGINNITYAGSHGLKIIHPDGSTFTYPMPKEFEETAEKLLKVLQDQVCRDGAWVENKGVYLTFHYRETPVDLRADLLSRAIALIEEHGFIPSHAHAAVEAKPPIGWNKGRASIYILRTAFGLDWSNRVTIIYAGDDTTDEDAMQALKGMAITFRITTNDIVKTAADRRLPSTDSVLTLLKWVERCFTTTEVKSNSSISNARDTVP